MPYWPEHHEQSQYIEKKRFKPGRTQEQSFIFSSMLYLIMNEKMIPGMLVKSDFDWKLTLQSLITKNWNHRCNLNNKKGSFSNT